MTAQSTESSPVRGPPRVVAVSGILFSVCFIISLVLIRLTVPTNPTEPGQWLTEAVRRQWFGIALNLIPFCGIAFLWFMAVLRNRIGLSEDRFFATVFLGSGLLFVAMLFAAAAVAQGVYGIGMAEQQPIPSGTYRVARGMVYALLNTFGMRMAAVFMFMTSTIGLRTGVLARWVSFVGYALGLVLLFVITDFAWIALVFPCWVLLVSTWILIADFRSRDGNNMTPR